MKIAIAHFSSSWVDTSGGVEKTVCALSSAMVARGHEVTILYIEHREGAPYFPLDQRVKTQNLLYENGRQIVMDKLPLGLRIYRETARLFSQRKAREINARFKGRLYGARIRQWFASHTVDVVLSVSPMSAKYLLLDGECRVPVIEMTGEDPHTGFPALSALEREAVSRAKWIQVLLPRDEEAARTYFPALPVTAIGNAVESAGQLASPGKKKCKYKIINVGTVCSRKNQKLLVEAFADLAEQYPDWDVDIWGWHGAYYGKALQQYINKKHLQNRVKLKGVTKDIASVYANGDIFAYPSESEGFPNGVLEAMAAGLPVIGLAECHGTDYLVKDGETGFLVRNEAADFRTALKKLMDDASLRAQMGEHGRNDSLAYAPEKTWDEWESLLKRVVQGTN